MKKSCTIVLLCGSMDPASYTHIALRTLEKLLRRAGAQTHLICVREHVLPPFDPTLASYPEEAEHIRQRIREADGIVAGSPEYHGGITGVLKNLIDHLDIPDFQGKPVALLATSGKKGGINTLNALRLVFRALYAPVIVEQTVITQEDFDPNKKLPTPETLYRLMALTKGLLREIEIRRQAGMSVTDVEGEENSGQVAQEVSRQ